MSGSGDTPPGGGDTLPGGGGPGPAGDDLWHREEPQSPCVNICVIHPAEGLCVGCLRTRDEIAAWAGMAPAHRRALMARLPERARRLARRRGGRAGRLPGDG